MTDWEALAEQLYDALTAPDSTTEVAAAIAAFEAAVTAEVAAYEDGQTGALEARTVDLLRAARNYLRADEDAAKTNHPYSMEFLAFLAEVDDHLRHIDGTGCGT